jgi:aminoglycoside phosphotransferase
MNFARAYLDQHADLLPPEQFGRSADWIPVMITPTFATSAHVVFVIYKGPARAPVLVLKVARAGHSAALARETERLRQVQRARLGGFDSIPRVIASGPFHGVDVLLQTALGGQPVTRRTVARRFDECARAVLDWILELHRSTRRARTSSARDTFDAHAAGALDAAAALFPNEPVLLRRTDTILRTLRGVDAGTVFEHGDLGAPNLLLDDSDRLQVVDWELASPHGLPGADLFFALHYLARARCRSRSDASLTAAAHAAFFGAAPWAGPIVEEYRSRLGIPAELIRPLFVLCWLRYTVGLARRLGPGETDTAAAAWLRRAPAYQLWEKSVLHFDELLPATATAHAAHAGQAS